LRNSWGSIDGGCGNLMPVVEGHHDHEGDCDGGDEGEGNEAVEEGQVGSGCWNVLRGVRFGFGAEGITHT